MICLYKQGGINMIRKYEILKAADEHYAGNEHRRDRFIFREGAKWADQTMIDKAVKWLEYNLPIGLMQEEISDFIEDFRKAREK